MNEKDLRKHSKIVVDGVEQAPSRSMLRAVGFEDEDFKKPQIGIASTWSMVTPCNMHINKLAEDVNDFRRHLHGHRGHEVFPGLP